MEFQREAYNTGRIPGHYVPPGLLSYGGVTAIRVVVEDNDADATDADATDGTGS